ncbi:hypothetical protein BT96DRAFT_1043005 [Gymnopus androsaceus JB14]|uniref:Uncharacterized protein n=1 Tax=Gymnopus androsaceus JB14 TaxID=1447944 RepID=A0A6A4HBR7_9AGAR|nr:hypothetical protein BT96DRAFT_1043005 [Gymnopus androsaceus JB14]
MSTMFLAFVLTWLNIFLFWLSSTVTVASISPRDCLQNSTIASLIDCLNDFTVGPNYYNASSYAAAQPDLTQVDDWMALITSMLDSDTSDCSSITVPASLVSIYAVTLFPDSSSNNTFCVLSEKTSFIDGSNSYYTKGWGVIVVPSSRKKVSHMIHLSAPHPLYDIDE